MMLELNQPSKTTGFTLVELLVTANRLQQDQFRLRPASPGKRFTLVELLVVIAIISILAGMLLPALGKAQAMARSITCLSNQKQCGMGLVQYTDIFNGYIPRCEDDKSAMLGRSWVDQLTYGGNIMAESVVKTNIVDGRCVVSWLNTGNVFQCPSVPVPTYFRTSGTDFNNEPCSALTYGMRGAGLTWYYPGERFGTGSIPVYSFLNPDVPFLGDTIRETGGILTQSSRMGLDNSTYSRGAGNIALNHNETGNVWFPDGHATAWNAADMLNTLRPHSAGETPRDPIIPFQ